MRRFLTPLAAILIISGFLVWWFSPKQVLKRQTKDLLEVLTMPEGTAPMSRIQGSFKLDRLLAKKVEIEVPSVDNATGEFDKAEVGAAFQWLCNAAKETRLNLEAFDSIEIEGDKATVITTLDALIDLKSYRPVDGPGESTFTWRKSEDGWLLEKAVWKSSKP